MFTNYLLPTIMELIVLSKRRRILFSASWDSLFSPRTRKKKEKRSWCLKLKIPNSSAGRQRTGRQRRQRPSRRRRADQARPSSRSSTGTGTLTGLTSRKLSACSRRTARRSSRNSSRSPSNPRLSIRRSTYVSRGRATVDGLVCGLHVNSCFLCLMHVNSLTYTRGWPPNLERLVFGFSDADFASNYSLESSWRDLQDLHIFALLRLQHFRTSFQMFCYDMLWHCFWVLKKHVYILKYVCLMCIALYVKFW